jgi:hypothetical protein
MIKDIINYEQTLLLDGEIPRNYYDPNIMLAEHKFCLQPGEEILVVINGNGYRFSDDTIFTLETPTTTTTTSLNTFENTSINRHSDSKTNDIAAAAAVVGVSGKNHPENNINSLKSEIKSIIPSSFSSNQLCVYLKNTSKQYTIYVGYKSSLAWLLDMPRIYSKLCFCAVSELTRLKMIFKQLHHDPEHTNDWEGQKFEADNETICLHD